jgi:hypothetical protein
VCYAAQWTPGRRSVGERVDWHRVSNKILTTASDHRESEELRTWVRREPAVATVRVPLDQPAEKLPQGDAMVPEGKSLISYEDALNAITEDQQLRATVYAMNTLLIQKGFYTAEEFRFQFRQSAQKQLKKASRL